jgi:hypothetical protein
MSQNTRNWFGETGFLWVSLLAVILGVFTGTARADVAVYTQPPNAAGGQYKSAWYAPDGLDDDAYVWDAFTLPSNTAITQVQWRGAYTNYLSGAGLAPVYNFTVAIYSSIAAGSQPDIINGRLVRYQVGGNASETPAGAAGGVAMYDYHFVLPSPFQAAGGTKYWIQIYASQGLTPTYFWPPDWSLARGTGGDGSHFRRVGGTGGSYTSITGDCAFTLLASGAPSSSITATVSPVDAGTIMGAGDYPNGSVATLIATPNHSFGFVNWTESGTQVSANPSYSFTVSNNRTLVANFIPSYTVITNSSPTYGGTTTGGGVYNDGANVTVTATPAHGFVFSEWNWFGTPMSTSATYTFPAASDITLTAVFAHAPGAATFDFDDAPVHTSLPISLISDGLGAAFSATASGYSIQAVGTVGLAPAGMSGLYLYPNSVFASDLIVDFSASLIDFSIMYSPQELGCDSSATMRVTAFMDGVQVGTNTATAPVPGTWPTGTLSIAVPSGFNRAVVHYDARPPTCQDYGAIFLADNLTVTRTCVAASISGQPTSLITCPTGNVSFAVAAVGTGPFAYQWQLETSPNNWIDAIDGGLPYNGGTIIATGATSNLLQLNLNVLPGAPPIRFRCIATNACGAATTDPASLTVCPADYNCSGAVSVQDIFDFLAGYFTGDPAADFNHSGSVSVQDIFDYLAAYFAGCP